MSLEWTLFGLRIIAAIILYTFLGLAFYLIWRDLRYAAASPARQRSQQTHQLRVVKPAANGALNVGLALPLSPVTLLGHDPGNTIVITDDCVSARHARLRYQNEVWWLEDLGSQHGTMLNELPLVEPAPLAVGDIIGIGHSRLRLEKISD